jgi:uncharacterized surface anchored protein
MTFHQVGPVAPVVGRTRRGGARLFALLTAAALLSSLMVIGAGRAEAAATPFEVQKVDAITGKPLADAGFTFYDHLDAVIGHCVTDATGFCHIDGSTDFSFKVAETTPPTGYSGQPGKVPAGPYPNPTNNPPLVFRDQPTGTPLQKVFVKKVDGSTGAPLAGAIIKLLNFVGATQICTTDATGTCFVDDVPAGDYFWQERFAPNGYDVNQAKFPVTVIAGSTPPVVTVKDFLTGQPPTSRLTVKKVDATTNAVLSGADFTLSGTSQSCTTDAQGLCSISGLANGTYRWHESKAPTGYVAAADSADITIDDSNAGDDFPTTVVRDVQILTDLSVKKVDISDQTKTLAGAIFDLETADSAHAVKGSCTTTAAGTCTVSNLPFGSYRWVETAAPAGYDLAGPSAAIDVTAANAGTTIPATVVTDQSTGQPPTSTLTVKKVDATSSGVLAGAVFTLTGSGQSCTTDATGVCSISGLPIGTYTWHESTAPAGYVIAADPAAIQITAANAGTTFATTVVGDARALTALSVTKVDATNASHTLTGADFNLVTADTAATVVGTCTTGGSGSCTVSNLPFGSYRWVEIKAPTGYDLPASPSAAIDVTAANAGTTMAATVVSDQPTAPPVTSTLTVKKVDATSSGVLAGAVFTLTGSGQSCTTDATGVCSISGLATGTYTWHETTAPAGYVLAADPAAISITAANAGTTFPATVVQDARALTALSVKKVDAADSTKTLAGATFNLETTGTPATVVGSCTTTAPTGTCTVSNLPFGSYRWVEIKAPTGYDLPASPSAAIDVTAANAGTTMAATVVADQPTGQPPTSTLTVKKVDATSSGVLAGAVFTLTGSGQSCTTDAQGLCSISGLATGTYTWHETTAPTGYVIAADPAAISITAANAGTTFPTTVVGDARALTALSVKKVDAADSTKTLAGADFNLVTADTAATVVGTCTTGASGTCTVSNLPFGSYRWVEVKAPTGYDLPASPSAAIDVTAANAGTTMAATVVADQPTAPPATSTLTVKKIDATTGLPLAGAVFTLTGSSATCTTDAQGLCSISGLAIGTYTWHETAAPAGYVIAADPAAISITAANAGTTFATTVVGDARALTALTVQKVEAGNPTHPLAGATFNLVSVDSSATVGSCTTTAQNGSCTVSNLLFGTYRWVEVLAPAGYDLPANPRSAAIDVDASNAGTTIAATVVADQLSRSTLTVKKVDAADDTLPVAGATYQLYRESNGVVGLQATGDSPGATDTKSGQCTTAADGTCSLDGLIAGTYYWLETDAPTGYALSAVPSDAVVVDQSSAKMSTVSDAKLPTTPVTPATPGRPGTPGTPVTPEVNQPGGPLAFTGFSVLPIVGAATVLLAAGLLLLMTGRRRRTAD